MSIILSTIDTTGVLTGNIHRALNYTFSPFIDYIIDGFGNEFQGLQNGSSIEIASGLAVLNGGLAVSVARNIPFKKTYPAPGREFEKMPLPSDMKGAEAKKHDDII